MNKQTIRDIDLKGKTVFARLDWNVPVENGEVVDAFRLVSTKPTVDYLVEQGCRIVVASHLGRPDGRPDPAFSLRPVAQAAAEALGRPVTFAEDCVGSHVTEAVRELKAGQILCLENVRFHPEEEANDPAFAQQLAHDSGAEVFVYDAFASYRPHASTEGIAHVLPAVAGLLVEKEVDYITNAIEHPARPLVAIIGGAKVSTKLAVLGNLIPKVDAMLLTGPIANTFAVVQGHAIGQSVAERDLADKVKELMAVAAKENTQLFIPQEVVVSKSVKEAKDVRTVSVGHVADNDYILDASPAYAKLLKDTLNNFLDLDGKSTIIWNGPLGMIEIDEFRAGTRAMAEAVIASGATSIIGGGDTAAFLDEEGMHDKFTWVSTGGGASLELMSGGGLPCIDSLLDKA
jgi:3-phosphoglycerate kinase